MIRLAGLAVLCILAFMFANRSHAADSGKTGRFVELGVSSGAGPDKFVAGYLGMPVAGSVLSPVAFGSNRDPLFEARNRLVRLFPVHWAAVQDQTEVIEILIGSGKQVDDRDDEGRTPLMLAAAFGNIAAIQTLLSHGADIKARDWVNGDSALHYGARNGNVDTAELLIGRGASATAISSVSGRGAIHYAAAFGHRGMIRFLVETGVDPNMTDREGVSAIFYASRRNQFAAVELLQSLGGQYGGLHEAVNADDVGRVLTLLNSGADVDEPGLAGNPIHLAASKGSLGLVGILADNGADLDSDAGVNGSTPVHLAAMTDHPAIIEFLQSRGAELEVLDKEARTPLLVAANFGSTRAVEKLIRLGAEAHVFDGMYGRSPLHVAASYGHTDVLEVLLSSGSDVDEISPATGRSALHYAVIKDQIEAAIVLIGSGAKIDIRDNAGVTPSAMRHRGHQVKNLLMQLSAQ